jgi:transcription-repair coupling factor (superfamily II helicase)
MSDSFLGLKSPAQFALRLEDKLKNTPQNRIHISTLYGSSKTLFIKRIFGAIEKQIVLLYPDIQTAGEVKVELEILGLGADTYIIDDFKIETMQERLSALAGKDRFILVSSFQLLQTKLPSKERLIKNITKIDVGGKLAYEDILEYLGELNYNKLKFVESPGDYAVRGSLIDFWSYSENAPCRLEFDGDFLESLRYFDIESQRSSNKTESVTLAGNLEKEENRFEADITDYLKAPLFIASKFELTKRFDMKEDAPAENVSDEIEDEELSEDLLGEGYKSAPVKQEAAPEITSFEAFLNKGRWIFENELVDTETMQLNLKEPPAVNSSFDALYKLLKFYAEKNYKVIITAENDFQSVRLTEVLCDFNEEIAFLHEKGILRIITLPIRKGFILNDEGVAVLTDYQIFNKPYRAKSFVKAKKTSAAKDFSSIKRGDYVVHEQYGIARYMGLETIKIGEVDQESIKLQYAEGGIVYVNLNYLALVKKYSSQENVEPKLSTLGGTEWENAKKKVKKRIKEAARGLILLYAKRKSSKGYPFSEDTIWQKELEASFFYEDTPDQAKVSEDVKKDMEAENPMDRLVCGDVGFGKTEIAVRAAFKAAQDSKQTAVLVPTTILAEQHYNTFRDRLSQFPVRIAALSRFQSKAVQKEILEKVKAGKIDILVGTHRLLSKDVVFNDLGLLIIDEEHRFGVMAKEKLRSLKANVDTLTLTATPIPRTLNLSLLGARDLSIISTPPPNRQPIHTIIESFDAHKMRQWILAELARTGQVFIIHDRVQSIDKFADFIRKHVPNVKIGVAHGQMKPAHLEQVIYDFLNRKYDVLLATKIIESGIDIPNANTIIINRADRFGLAELHQLRGRVGRSDKQAFAYLLVPAMDSISKKAVKRLQAIEENSDIGAGFNLSMRDLEIRGAGNLLGEDQSGFFETVGFDMYVKLLDEAVEELKNEEFKEVFKEMPKKEARTDPKLDAYFEIGIPQAYMPEQADRLGFYTSLFSIKSLKEAEDIREELLDRFGKFPLLVERLYAMALLRYYASYALFERVIITRKVFTFILPKGGNEEYYEEKFQKLIRYVMEEHSKSLKFNQQNDVLKFSLENMTESPEKAIAFAAAFCKKVSKVVNKVEFKEDELKAAG